LEPNEEYIDLIISRYLAGEASPEEAMFLDDWIATSDENRDYFVSFRWVHSHVKGSASQNTVNVDRAWRKVQQQITPQIITPRRTKEDKRLIPWMQIAAGILVLIGFTTALYWILTSRANNQVQVVALVAKDSTQQYNMADSSQVVVRKGSTITYPSDYGRKKREVTLSGEAFFNVKHDVQKPFTVKADETFVKDVGTSFNVKANPQSKTVEVFVETGEVYFYTMNAAGITLKPGETGIYYKITRKFVRKEAIDINKLDLKRRSFDFQNTRLADAIEMLNRVYDQKIEIPEAAIANCRITVSFRNESLEMVVSVIAETLGVNYTSTLQGFKIYGNHCGSDSQ
jgi:ferric-dicitrate binding protein FerR (iron transport regulator)